MRGGTRKGAGRPYRFGEPMVTVCIPASRRASFQDWRDNGRTYEAGYKAGQEAIRERAAADFQDLDLSYGYAVAQSIRALPIEEPGHA